MHLKETLGLANGEMVSLIGLGFERVVINSFINNDPFNTTISS